MFRDIPDHPDIECALRTGYPRSYHSEWDDDYDDDFEYESRREEELFDDYIDE